MPAIFSAVRGRVALIVAVCMGCSARSAQGAEDALWELTPYQVRVLVALAPSAEPCGNLATELPTALAARAWGAVGARWTLAVEIASGALREELVYRFDSLDAKQLLEAAPEECDKLLLVRVAYEDGAYRIDARDFDVRTQLLSAAQTEQVVQRQRLAETLFARLLAVFSPLARVDEVSGDKVTLRLRAGAVPLRDPAVERSFEKGIFRPVVRRNDRAGKAQLVQPIDWSYLVVEAADGARLSSRLVTGLRTPLVSKRRGRIEQLALYIHPPQGSTLLELRAADKQARPLAGYQVYSHPVDAKETTLLGATDSRGILSIPPAEGAVRVLLVKSGNVIMARMPLLPGLTPTAVAQVPDDQRRLQVEGVITGLQEELVDQIARRQALIARIHAQIKAGKTDQAKNLMNELRRLRSQQDFTRQLLVERQRWTSPDPQMQRQIDKLFDDTQTVINRFLDARQVERLEREFGESAGEATAQTGEATAQNGEATVQTGEATVQTGEATVQAAVPTPEGS